MALSTDDKEPNGFAAGQEFKKASDKLSTVSGVYIPVFLNILSILLFLRFGVILGHLGFVGMIGLMVIAYCINFLTTFSLSAIASNGEVKGGGAYYLISRSLGPEFGGSIGILFYLAQVLNTALNVVGLIDCIRLNLEPNFPQGYWKTYGLETAALVVCTGMCLLGSATFSKASNALLAILLLAVVSIPISVLFKEPFDNDVSGIHFTGFSLETLADNFLPHTQNSTYQGLQTFRHFFGILFPATSGIFAGASMSGDLRNPSKAIPKGTLWATLTTFITYFIVILSMASSTTHESFLANPDVISHISLWRPIIFAGECAVTFFSALMGLIGSAKLFQALARDQLLPGLLIFGKGTKSGDEPLVAVFLTYIIAQLALFADLNQIATLISMGYQMTFFVMNLACFLLKIGSAPNFRPGFKFFSWQTACLGALSSATAMFFIDETYAAIAITVLVFLFLLIHYLCPPKRWGDVSQNLIYHQVRKYLLRLKPEHIKFWRPHVILLVNNPRRQTRLIQFCNSMKKGSLYILGHVIVTDDFTAGVTEAKVQQQAWTNYISESSRIKAFVQLTMSPSITWGIRNLILSAGLGGMRPNLAVLGFYNMEDLRKSNPRYFIPEIPSSPAAKMSRPPTKSEGKMPQRRRGDTSARLLDGFLPTDVIRTENMMKPTEYMTMVEDLALHYRLNVAIGYGFDRLETPRKDKHNTKKFIDLWPIQMSAEITSDGKNVLTTNFDTYTLILQLGHILNSVQTWRHAYRLRVMVFVEYESEVQEESARVKALLDKLRIEADILVFWLASGELNTYELIINGNSNDIDWEIVVNDALKDEEWWDDLQMFRGQMDQMSSSQERTHLASILDATSGRPGVYNPHGETLTERRRSILAELPDLPKNPAISILSKFGVNPGIHTHHLSADVLEESDSEYGSSSEGETAEDEDAISPGFNPEMIESRADSIEPITQPLLQSKELRRRRHGYTSSGDSSIRSEKRRRSKPGETLQQETPYYGTIGASQMLSNPAELAKDSIPEVVERSPSPQAPDSNAIEPFPPLEQETPVEPGNLYASQPESPVKGTSTPTAETPTGRPSMSRQSSAMRFSSRPVPETTVTPGAEGSKLAFAEGSAATAIPKVERPGHSRQSSYNKSYGKFSSRPMPDTKVSGGEAGTRTISFAEHPTYHQPPITHSRHHSRRGSARSTNTPQTPGDVSVNIPQLLDSYKFDQNESDESGSSYSTQSVALSFNDLPSRAQHLILNELMRQNSGDTAVLLSTLPIPCEGTSLDRTATVQYLSDIEVLCNELPPTLMVLSNNMTVTVSL